MKGSIKDNYIGFDFIEASVLSNKMITRKEGNFIDERIIRYLRSGFSVVGCPELMRDAFDPASDETMGSCGLSSDGVWLWPDVLPGYLWKYDFNLPKDFNNRIISLDYNVPYLSNRKESRIVRTFLIDVLEALPPEKNKIQTYLRRTLNLLNPPK